METSMNSADSSAISKRFVLEAGHGATAHILNTRTGARAAFYDRATAAITVAALNHADLRAIASLRGAHHG